MPLDPWIIEEIKKKEERERQERERQQPTVEIDDREPLPDTGERKQPGHEMPADRKPGHEMPNPNQAPRPSEKKDEEPKRGVDISRISGSDEEDEDDGAIVINIKDLPVLPAEEPVRGPSEKKPEKKPE